jgi:hypothetical protein
MRRDIFYRPQTMKFLGSDTREDAQHFDPEFPSGLRLNSKSLTNWNKGCEDWKYRGDAVVTPRGRQTERTVRREIDPYFGITIQPIKRRR